MLSEARRFAQPVVDAAAEGHVDTLVGNVVAANGVQVGPQHGTPLVKCLRRARNERHVGRIGLGQDHLGVETVFEAGAKNGQLNPRRADVDARIRFPARRIVDQLVHGRFAGRVFQHFIQQLGFLEIGNGVAGVFLIVVSQPKVFVGDSLPIEVFTLHHRQGAKQQVDGLLWFIHFAEGISQFNEAHGFGDILGFLRPAGQRAQQG